MLRAAAGACNRSSCSKRRSAHVASNRCTRTNPASPALASHHSSLGALDHRARCCAVVGASREPGAAAAPRGNASSRALASSAPGTMNSKRVGGSTGFARVVVAFVSSSLARRPAHGSNAGRDAARRRFPTKRSGDTATTPFDDAHATMAAAHRGFELARASMPHGAPRPGIWYVDVGCAPSSSASATRSNC